MHEAPGRATSVTGVKVETLSPKQKLQLHLSPNSPAVIVTKIDPLSDIGRSGSLQPGDVIHEVNRQPVNTPLEFYTALDNMPLNRRSILFITRRGTYGFVMLVPSKPEESPVQEVSNGDESKIETEAGVSPPSSPGPDAPVKPKKSTKTPNP